MQIKLSTPQDFSFNECLVSLQGSALETLYSTTDVSVRKLLNHQNEAVLWDVQSQGNNLLLTPLNCDPAKEAVAFAKTFFSDWFDLEQDLIPFYKMAGNDPLLAPVVERYRGLRIIGIPDLFEALSWAIIGQQINLTFAHKVKRRLIELCGKSINHGGQNYWCFPTPKAVAELPFQDLLDRQFSRRKAEYIQEVARQMSSGKLSKTELHNLGTANKMRKRLVAIRGIGNWTADYAMMKTMHITEAFPIADVGLHNAIKIQLGLEKKPSIPEIEKMAKGWKNWEAYATCYLWRSLSDGNE